VSRNEKKNVKPKRKKTSSYIPLDSPIDRLHPMVKIYGILCLGFGCAVFPFEWLSFVVAAFLFVIAYKAKILDRFSKFIFAFAVPITCMLLIIQGLYSPKNVTVLADFGAVQLGLEGVRHTFNIVGTLLVFLGSFYIMTTTTYPGKLVTALQDAGLNPKAGYLILACLNVVPQIQRRIVTIQEAQTSRGVEVTGNVLQRFKAFLPIIGPTVMSSLVDVQERGMTLETRGFGAKDASPSSFIELTITDKEKTAILMLKIFAVACLAVTVIGKLCLYFGGRG
jgi:energy-coupling factor transport system permease protein